MVKMLENHSQKKKKCITSTVVECPFCDRENADLIPSRVIPKTLKMDLAALLLGTQH